MNTTPEAGCKILVSRVIDAPVERVWDAWADPAKLARWFAPQPLTLAVDKMDLRAGGGFAMAMLWPDGRKHEFSGVYREVQPRARIVWTGEFPGDPKDNMRTEVTFEAQGTRTLIRVRQTFAKITPVNEQAAQGSRQGWTMTLDQLAGACKS